jgi:hypothetical protein
MGREVMEMAEGRPGRGGGFSSHYFFFCVHPAIILYHGFCKSQPALGEPAPVHVYHGKKNPNIHLNYFLNFTSIHRNSSKSGSLS